MQIIFILTYILW